MRETDAWTLLDNLDTCVCVSRFDTGEILYTNRKTRDEFGLKDEPRLSCWEAFREGASAPCDNCPKYNGKVREGVPYVWESYNAKIKKHYKNIESIITWNGEKSYMQHFLDITEIRETEAALEAALENSKHLNDAKSEFLSRMSHEIRTPMNAVIGMTKIAKQSKDDAEIQSCLDNIDASAKQLRAIINDIFDVSKIETRTLELVNASFNIKKTMAAVYEEYSRQAAAKKQRLTFIPDDTISAMYIGDEARLSQVAGNLLSNAVKFTPEEGQITLSVRQTVCDGSTAVAEISVTDTGIGISKENIVKLFSPFEQLDGGKSRKYGGTGLGLVLSKNIVELMGGEFNVKSEEGNGATFTFTAKFVLGGDIPEELPAAEEPAAGKPEAEKTVQERSPEENGAGKKLASPVPDLVDIDGLLPFINVRRGLENLKGNGRLYAVLLRSYQKNDFTERIRSSLSSANFKDALQIAQALQNIAVSIGLDDLRGKMEMLLVSIRGMADDGALMEKAASAAKAAKKLIPGLILALEEGKLS